MQEDVGRREKKDELLFKADWTGAGVESLTGSNNRYTVQYAYILSHCYWEKRKDPAGSSLR